MTILYETLNKKIVKSLKKYEKNKGKSCYKDSKLIRPILLNVLRHYDTIQDTFKYNTFLKVCYLKCLEFIPSMARCILKMEGYDNIEYGINYNIELNYLKIIRKNLEKIKKKCEKTSLSYYNLLPGDKLPLDIRNIIVSFISIAPIKF